MPHFLYLCSSILSCSRFFFALGVWLAGVTAEGIRRGGAMTVASRLQTPLSVWKRRPHQTKMNYCGEWCPTPLFRSHFLSVSLLRFQLCDNTFIISRLKTLSFNWLPCKHKELCSLYGFPLISLNTAPLPNCSNYNRIRWDHGHKFVNKFVETLLQRHSFLSWMLQQGISNLFSPHWCFSGPQLMSDCIPLFHQSKHCLSLENIFTAP